MTGADVKAMMFGVAQAVIANVDVLSEADRATGDGDHGVGMRRGFEAAQEALVALDSPTPEQVMRAAGTAIMTKGGGASGAIFGTLFRAGSKALAGNDKLDAASFAQFLLAASEAVQKRGGVTIGQKTMLDALAPAAAAAVAHDRSSLVDAMAQAAEAAAAGVEVTRNLLATTGKARSLGERSLGHIDPGALSVSIILKAMSDWAATA